MSVSDILKNNLIYKLIVVDTLREQYNWNKM